MPIVMGTAGHIDHGKTSLIKAITGIDCDRLAEEKERGITIELGFAFMDLPGGQRLGIVDVPGHEKFVKNMVSGAAGIDFVLLVVAADEGVMPQTREHVEICRLLGIRHGLVALTKADMVDPELLDMAVDDVRGYLAGSFLEDAPLVACSSRTGQGLDELRAAIAAVAGRVTPRRESGVFRLPVDRAFVMKGFGTVVTGTCIAGSIKVGEAVTVYPSGAEARVRGLQSHGSEYEEAGAGRRMAVNLAGVDLHQVERGDTLARPGTLFPETAWDVELICLASSPRSLKHRREVHVHHGSREVLARLHFLEREELKPGETAPCQIRFQEPLAGMFGDRVVVRAFSPLRTVAGGVVLSPFFLRTKRFSPAAAGLAALAGAEPPDLAVAQLARRGAAGLDLPRLGAALHLDAKQTRKVMDALCSAGRAFLTDRDGVRFHDAALVASLEAGLTEHLANYHRRYPMRPGMPRGELVSAWGKGLDPGLAHFVLQRTLRRNVTALEGDAVRLVGHQVSLAADESALKTAILEAHAEAGRTPPNLKDVLERSGVTEKAAAPVLRHLQEAGLLVKVNEGLWYHAPALEEVRELMRGFFAEREELSAPDFKALTGLSRKYIIALLEYFDRERFTVRVGDVRRLRRSAS
ncbi:MAG: selenocysteine-specific translation elongation factor [Desulfovibrionaceae bacterium]